MCDCSCHSVCVEVRGQLEDIFPSTIWVPYIKPRQTLWQVSLVSHITSSKMVFFFKKKNSLVFCKSNAQLANYPLPYLEEAYGKAMEFYSRIL